MSPFFFFKGVDIIKYNNSNSNFIFEPQLEILKKCRSVQSYNVIYILSKQLLPATFPQPRCDWMWANTNTC